MKVIKGNLLDYANLEKGWYIAHQCNCISRTPKHLSHQVFSRFPEANIYNSGEKRIPGTIMIRGNVINILSQHFPGKARRETYAQRREWLQQGLNTIYDHKEIKTVFFPYGFGCGMAGDNWKYIRRIFQQFIERMNQDNRNVHFIVYNPKEWNLK